ncbi:OLC1v1028582C2 [Oldenlandia corymbosa var. corymbosa]|uniref:OLC1v1028582C2 n=2 Tax=Oldenlandia corymbosa var. corymbosa TaxID=529605 RepID=A0AAV1CCS7_OLDCO|nr:OLC1v1028582C2 [Oldenlandia corymbosa var. corymbosa]
MLTRVNMGGNFDGHQTLSTSLSAEFENLVLEGEVGETRSPNQSRPASMVFKKPHTVIPAHLVAEAISTLHGLDLRWSGPITPSERQYVQQYVLAKYPEYCNGLVEEGDKIDLYKLCINEDSSSSGTNTPDHEKGKSPKSHGSRDLSSSLPSSSPSFGNFPTSDLDKTQLEPSKLLDILNKKASLQGNFISIPEIQVRNRALQHCGLSEEEYLVHFATTPKEATMLIGESYPFFRGNYYMTILGEEYDSIRGFVLSKDSKVIVAPEKWLDLRIKGSQLSQYFRKKCKYSPKGLFAYPAHVNETRYSMHWISEAHRNSWHVLLDATGLDLGKDRLTLALHRPDFVLCSVENPQNAQPSRITCLLVRRKSFDISAPTFT